MHSRRIVLIRAVNVGGAKLPMADLRGIAESLGARDISTYIASGNLLCTPPQRTDFDNDLSTAIETRFGYSREVISRSADEVAAALAVHPFEVSEEKFSYLHFLVASPSAEGAAGLTEKARGGEQVQVIGDEVHIRYPSGAGQSKLDAATLARTLGVQGTARNLRTVKALLRLAREPQ